jgi:uncharacterized protein YegP (UPF0339 family)
VDDDLISAFPAGRLFGHLRCKGADMARFELYKGDTGEFRWRFISSNGRIIADSGESYKNKADCQSGIDLIKAEAPAARVEEK